MNTKMKAFAAVFLMVALSFAVAIPAVASDDQSEGAKWTSDKTLNVVSGYDFSYKVVLPMSSAVFYVKNTGSYDLTYSAASTGNVDVGGSSGEIIIQMRILIF